VTDDSGRDLHRPVAAPPSAAAIVLHPHPSMGGDRHHPLVIAEADGLAAAGVAALRVDLTDPDFARSAAELEGIADELRAEVGAERLFLVGYSWGAIVSATAAPAGLAARVLVAPPVSMVDLPTPTDRVPTLALVPAHDQYSGPEAVRAAMARWDNTTIEVVDGIDHFLSGAIARITTRAVTWLTER
jgi:alpha/beta superfamily hydrolase